MDIAEAQRKLGPVDMQALGEAILAQEPEAWTEQTYRQEEFDVHRQTESIVLLFCDEDWPDGEVHKEAGWKRLSDIAMPLIDDIIRTHYEPGGTVLRAMAAKLKAGGIINPHKDAAPSFHIGHRIHIPIVTHRGVRFTIEGVPYKFDVGQAYEINNQKTHSVLNRGTEDRIHFIFDYAPPGIIESHAAATSAETVQ